MNKLPVALICFCFVFASCTTLNTSSPTTLHPSQQAFWTKLNALCGKAFYGKVVEAPANDTVFRNQQLILHIRSCGNNRIRTPFIVGNNRSRTFVFTRSTNGIELKHDHRHMDGAEDSLTMYGGFTSNSGRPDFQVFPADQHTVNILPAAAGNVWWIEIAEGKYISYNLRRIGTDRLFTVRFDLNDPAPTPPAPWGWKD